MAGRGPQHCHAGQPARHAGLQHRLSPRPAWQVPTLIIHGTDDRTVPIESSARPTAQAIRTATLLEYDGAPHGLFATHTSRLAHDLLAFLGR